jgi:hypothetical protein
MTTRWQQVIGAFAAMHLSKTAVAVLDMAYRYIFFLSESASEMFEACFSGQSGKFQLVKAAAVRAAALPFCF